MNFETYIAFGDSITSGARTYLGYPELLSDALSIQLQKQWVVVNHSVNGFKTIDLARHIDMHFSSLKAFNASISTILIGTNDIKENTKANDFRIMLNQIILKTKLLTVNNNVIILAIPEFHKGIMYPYVIGMNETIKKYNAVINESAADHNIRMLTLTHTEQDFFDGVHLNDQGIESFSRQLLQFILKDKGIELG
jgi:lysophospholipase L1-like esterase